MAERLPEFSHIRPERILIVAGEARRASRGSIKPLTFAQSKSKDPLGHRKPVVRIEGKRMLYCITLRPLFFRESTARDRVQTLLHELFHVAPAFDGTLDEAHRHARLGPAFARTLRPLVRRYLRQCPKELLAAFSYDGEVRVHQWLERPGAYLLEGSGKVRRLYTEAQLFLATVRMVTPVAGPVH